MSPRSSRRRRFGGALATATAVLVVIGTAIGVRSDSPFGGGGGGSGLATIWVDTSGGTCVDNASAITYPNNGTECGSLDAANDIADNGDVVRIVSVSGNQTISGSNSRTADVLFKPQNDGTPVSLNGALVFQSTADRISMTSVHQTIDTDDYLNVLDISGDNLSFTDHTATRFDVNAGSDTVVIDASDFGPCIASYGTGGAGVTQNNQGVCNNRILDTATSVTVEDSSLHGNLQTWDGVSGPNGGPPHSECLAIFGGINVTLRRSKLWDCGDSAVVLIQANPGTGQKATNLSFVGNWVNVDWNATDGTATNIKCRGFDIRYNAGTGGADISGTFEFSFNTLNRCSSTSGLDIPWISTNSGDQRYSPNLTSARFIGNIGSTIAGGGDGPCPTNSGNTLMNYNVQWKWGGSGSSYNLCGTNATEANYTPTTFLTSDNLHGTFDFHLTGSTQAWETTIPTSVAGGCPIDIDGTTRPVGANCDPGSDER